MEEFYANVSTEDLLLDNMKSDDSADNKLEKLTHLMVKFQIIKRMNFKI